ncbi:ATP-binding protein [Pontibacter diazotrophicus]|uniref:ATP-binding protein n=1 Tax=Pontibacter diazotrophicus TaxID=1400979 RepID=A0A3D8L9D8_9BACT|nr:AAA family ATPase [Pontibacter diazotrophicus]RDV14039.1 ATP-binding protein [Pontibacter diazotrophicus]
MQAIIFCGIQASGKSTFYKEHFFDTHMRISMDLLRTRNRERLFLEACIRSQMRFVVDNTNPTAAERQKYIELAKAARYEVIGYYFESTTKDALARNSLRSGRFLIPEKGIYGTHKRLLKPSLAEGFDMLYHVRLQPDSTYSIKLVAEL